MHSKRTKLMYTRALTMLQYYCCIQVIKNNAAEDLNFAITMCSSENKRDLLMIVYTKKLKYKAVVCLMMMLNSSFDLKA